MLYWNVVVLGKESWVNVVVEKQDVRRDECTDAGALSSRCAKQGHCECPMVNISLSTLALIPCSLSGPCCQLIEQHYHRPWTNLQVLRAVSFTDSY